MSDQDAAQSAFNRLVTAIDDESAFHAIGRRERDALYAALTPELMGRLVMLATPYRHHGPIGRYAVISEALSRPVRFDQLQATLLLASTSDTEGWARYAPLMIAARGVESPDDSADRVAIVRRLAASTGPRNLPKFAELSLVAPASSWRDRANRDDRRDLGDDLVDDLLGLPDDDRRRIVGTQWGFSLSDRDAADSRDLLAARPVAVDHAAALLERAADLVDEDPGISTIESGWITVAAGIAQRGDADGVAVPLARLLRSLGVSGPVRDDDSLEPVAANTAIGILLALVQAPTPELLAAVAEIAPLITDPKLAKRAKRELIAARKALPHRVEVALRIPADADFTAARKRGFLAALEGAFAVGRVWDVDDWQRSFARPETRAIARGLVWVAEDGDGRRALLRSGADGTDTAGTAAPPGFEDAETGDPVALDPAARTRLWHPAEADADERARVRRRVAEQRIVQPFRQAWREHYSADAGSIDDLVGTEISGRVLVSVAKSDGWTLNDGVLERRYGSTTATLHVNDTIFPGYEGQLSFHGVDLIDPVRGELGLGDLPTVLASEVLRAIDLLLSVAAIEKPGDGDPLPWSDSPGSAVALRRIVVDELYADESRVTIDGRRVVVGDWDVHLATGRVRREGEQAELDAPARRRRNVPVNERTLTLVLDRVDAILALS